MEKSEEKKLDQNNDVDIISDILMNLPLLDIDENIETSENIKIINEDANESLSQNKAVCVVEFSEKNKLNDEDAFCTCKLVYEEKRLVGETCPYCQLLRCNLNSTKKKNIDLNNEYFNNAISQSQTLLQESSSWLMDVKTPSLKKPYDETILFQKVTLQNRSDQKILNDIAVTDLESKDSKRAFNSLPSEILLKIFSFFTQRELCRYIAPVCSMWFQLAKDPTLWSVISAADYGDVRSELLIDVIVSWCKQLSSLELNRRPEITVAEFHELFKNCPHLKHISFAFCTQVNNEILQLLSTYCKSLHSVNLEGCGQISDQSFYSFVGLPIDRVNVSHCNQLSDEGGIFLARNFKNLTEVDFDGIQWMTEDFVQMLVDKHYGTLRKVYLDGENLGDDCVHLFSKCVQLSTLSFSFCTNMTHVALEWIGECTKLNHLKMRKGANFTQGSLLKYLKNLTDEQASGFKYLNLSECSEISDECLFFLGEKCRNLEVLDLSWCWEVSDDGLAFIIDNCHELKELYLRGLHELYGTSFSKISTSLPKLTFLDLSQCNKVQDELIECVVQKMKTLVILNYYGDVVVNVLHRRAHLLT